MDRVHETLIFRSLELFESDNSLLINSSSSSSIRFNRSLDFIKGNFRLNEIFCPLCLLLALLALSKDRSKLVELLEPWNCNLRLFLPIFRSQRILEGIIPKPASSPLGRTFRACHHSSSEALVTCKMSP